MIRESTPRSEWFDEPPPAEVIEASFDWPIFVKGGRQTSRHNVELAIIASRQAYGEAVEKIRCDPMLHWQEFVVREFVPLTRVGDHVTGKIPASFEYRTFWWRGTCVAEGRYYPQARPYKWDRAQRTEALALARQAAKRVDVTFLVVDLALSETGRWIIVELNDGQESGYAGCAPHGLWQNIIDSEKQRMAR